MDSSQIEDSGRTSCLWSRVNQMGPEAPRAWKNLNRLYDAAREREVSKEDPMLGRLSTLLGPESKELDRRDTLLASEAWMHANPDKALDTAAELLDLRGLPDWEEMRPALSLILRQFYEVSGDNTALINVEATREPIEGRLPQFREIIRPSNEPKFLYRPTVRGNLILKDGVSIRADQLRWAIPKDREHFELEITELPIMREFATSAVFKFFSTYWFLSNRRDVRHQFADAFIPLYDPNKLPNNVKRHRLLVFAKVETDIGYVSSYGFDLNAETGAIYSIRFAENSLALWSAMDPWFDEMVSKRSCLS